MSAFVKVGAATVVLVGVFALTWFLYFPHSPLGRQEANLKLAEEYGPKVMKRLRQMTGTDKVRVGAYTGLGGSLSVSGDVADEQTAEAVITAVVASSPPVSVRFLLTIGGTNIVQKIVEPDGAANGSQ